MKKVRILLAILLLLTITLSCCACKVKEGEACASPISLAKPGHPFEPKADVNFDRTATSEGITFYFSSSLQNGKYRDGVENVLLVQKYHTVPSPVFLVCEGATYLSEDGLYFNLQDQSALLLAVLLESEAKERLPFGLFAGVAAEMLQDEAKTERLSDSKYIKLLKRHSFITDLQYPLYAAACADSEVRAVSWAYAAKLGKLWLKEHAAEDLKNAASEDVSPLLSEIGAARPAFYCPVGDFYYPIQFVTENFCYFLDPAFEDARLKISYFSADYPSMRGYVLENERIFSKVLEILPQPKIPPLAEDEREEQEQEDAKRRPINVFLGDFGLSPALGYNDYRKESICLKSVSSTIYMMAEYVLLKNSSLGLLRYGLCDYFNNFSSYVKPAYFDLYCLKTENSNYERELLVSAKNLYNKNYNKSTYENFDPIAYSECLTACLNEQEGGKIVYIGQLSSLIKYVYENLGAEALFQLDNDMTVESAESGAKELIEKWQAHLLKIK